MRRGSGQDLRLTDLEEIPVGRLLPPPSIFPAPLVGQSSRLLPLLDLGAGHFESFGLEAVAHLDGLTEARIYGRSGQTQHGIDVYGRRRDGETAVYQMRCRDQALTAKMLRKAVKDYFGGRRPHDASSFQLCWARRVDDVAVDDELRRLREEYSDKTIELRDQARFTSELIVNRLLVLRWFGETTTNAAYGAFAQAPNLDRAYDTDGLLRGPLAAFYLVGDLQDAIESREHDPGRAAARLEEIANKIEARGYVAHAAEVRGERLTALAAAGEVTRAYLEILAALETHVDRGLPAQYFSELRRMENLRSALTDGALPPARPALASQPVPDPPAVIWPVTHPQVQRSVALLAVDAARNDSTSGIAELRDATHAFVTATGDMREGTLAALRRVAEIALLADDRDTLATVGETTDGLDPLPAARTMADEDDEIRLQLAIADASGGYDLIESKARYGAIPQRLVGVVHARRARWHNWNAEPNQALQGWFEAIQAAGGYGHREDAADYLWAVRSVDTAYRDGLPSADAIEYGRRAQALDPQGRSFFVRSQGEIDALRALREIAHSTSASASPNNNARRLLKQLLLESIVRADVVGEVDTHRMLAELHLQQSEASDALHHAVRAGDTRVAAAAAQSLGADALAVLEGSPAAPWCTRASLAAFTAVGDVITRDQVAQHLPWIKRCLAVQVSDGWTDNGIRDLAMSVLETIASQLMPGDADTIEELITPYLNLEVRQSTMRAAVGVLARMFRANPGLAMPRNTLLKVIETLPPFVAQDAHQAGDALALLSDELEAIASRSEDENSGAVELLAYLGIAHPKVLSRARALAQVVLDTPTGVARTQYEISGPSHELAGMYARLLPPDELAALAQKLIKIAQDGLTTEFDRSQAVRALGHLAPKISDRDRRRVFIDLWPLINGLEPTDVDVRFGRGSLPAAVLRTAAKSAVGAEQLADIERVASEWLVDADKAVAAAWALVDLRQTTPHTDETLAAHNNPQVQEAAAILWSRDPSNEELGRRLAGDQNAAVRTQLARALKNLGRDNEQIRMELEARLARDPSAQVRQAIKEARVFLG